MIGTAKKTRAHVNAEQNQRNVRQRIQGVGHGATAEMYLKWFRDHYTKKELHVDDKVQLGHFFAQQEKGVSPSYRTFLHTDETETPTYQTLQKGNTRAFELTEEEATAAKVTAAAKKRATLKERNIGQHNWMESSLIAALLRMFPWLRVEHVSDNCIVDVGFSVEGYEGYVPLQIKTAEWVAGRPMVFGVKREYGAADGKYVGLFVLAAGIHAPHDSYREWTPTGVSDVPDIVIKELFPIGDCAGMENKTLAPYAGTLNPLTCRMIPGTDDFEVKSDAFKEAIIARLSQKGAALSQQDLLFGDITNAKASPMRTKELRNLKAVSDRLPSDSLKMSFDVRQGETVDCLILRTGGGQLALSFKTATSKDGSTDRFFFHKGKSVNAQFCDFVFVFYRNQHTDPYPARFSVFSAREVYNGTTKNFCWNLKSDNVVVHGIDDVANVVPTLFP